MSKDEYSFGVFSCEAQSYVLRCGSAELMLPRRIFNLLLYLVREAGRVVTKDELVRTLWPDQFVTENSLSKAISDLRRILRRHSDQEYIRTVAAVGFQFVVPVDRRSVGGTVRKREERDVEMRVLIWPLQAGLCPDRGIARFVCDEVTALVASAEIVQRSPQVRLINGSPFSTTLAEARGQCDATCVVRGSMHRSGGTVRVSLELTDRSLETQSGEVFDVSAAESDALQRAIAGRVASFVLRSLEKTLEPGAPVPDTIQAFEAWSKAQYFWKTRTFNGLKRAAFFAQQTVVIDPKCVPAWVTLANSYAALIAHGEGIPLGLLRRARNAAEQALSIDSNSADAHVAMANLNVRFELDWVSAEANYRRAIELRPRSAMAWHWYGNALLAAGENERALSVLGQAFVLRPFSISIRTARAQAFYLAGLYQECHDQLQDILEMNPRSASAHFGLAMVYGVLGDPAKCIATFRRASQLAGNASFSLSSLGYAYAEWGGNPDEAARMLDRLQTLAATQYVAAYDVALLQGKLGQLKRAAAGFIKAHENRDALLMWLRVDPRLESVRRTGVLDDVLAKFRFPAPTRALRTAV